MLAIDCDGWVKPAESKPVQTLADISSIGRAQYVKRLVHTEQPHIAR
jgi:hypothetical protein